MIILSGITLLIHLISSLFLIGQGYILYGDLSTSFPIFGYPLSLSFFTTWNDNLFFGYPQFYYTLLRLPYYLFTDLIAITFGPNNFWMFFGLVWFLHYIFMFILLRYYKISKITAYFIALGYSFSIFITDRSVHTIILFASSFIPLTIYAYLQYLVTKKTKFFCLLSLSIWVILTSMHVTLLISYLFFFIGLKLFIESTNKKFFALFNIKLLLKIILIFSYIFLPYLLSAKENSPMVGVSNKLENAVFEYSKNINPVKSLVGSGYFASGLENTNIGIYLLIIIISIIFFHKGIKNDRNLKFWLSIWLFFSFIGSNLFLYLFKSISSIVVGLDYIKDLSYFSIITTFSFFIALGIQSENINILKKFKTIKEFLSYYLPNILLILIIIIEIYLRIHSFKNTQYFKTFNIPKSYIELKNKLNPNERYLIIPFNWVQELGWTDNNITSGFFSMLFFDYTTVGNTIIEGSPAKSTRAIKELEKCIKDNCPEALNKLEQLKISKIIIFKDFPKYQFYKNSLLQLNQSTKIFYIEEDTKDYLILKTQIKETKILYSEDLNNYKKINPSMYLLNLKQTKKINVFFLESYDPQWKIILYDNKNLINNFKIIDPTLYNNYANTYEFENKTNGAILIYLPQVYFYFGSIISVITIISLNIYKLANTLLKRKLK